MAEFDIVDLTAPDGYNIGSSINSGYFVEHGATYCMGCWCAVFSRTSHSAVCPWQKGAIPQPPEPEYEYNYRFTTPPSHPAFTPCPKCGELLFRISIPLKPFDSPEGTHAKVLGKLYGHTVELVRRQKTRPSTGFTYEWESYNG